MVMKLRTACALAALAFLLLASTLVAGARAASFTEFDRKAKAGDRLNVVFFGASLTWGANASDPVETSYRAVMRDRFEQHYPAAHFRFRDSAIGGTGSQLGAFRLDAKAQELKLESLCVAGGKATVTLPQRTAE